MGLYIEGNKYFCEHRVECPYRYCPWHRKGVRVDKSDFSGYYEERKKQKWFHLPDDSKDAEFCCNHMDV